ncbi:MAG TPA: thioredoxin family protein [Flavobacterium sp.]
MLVVLFFLLTPFATVKETTAGKGIDFFEGTFKEALAEAKKSGKPVFIDFYATWCGPCKKLKKTFRDKAVGDYFNKNFINISVDGETAEGARLLNQFRVNSYPTLLIVNADGKQLTKSTGYLEPYILINFGRRIVP